MKRERLSWPKTAIQLASKIAECRSQDPYIQVGSCVIRKDGTVSLGYNGTVPGLEIDYSDRNGRRPLMIHAESNVLDTCKPGEIDVFAVTHLPCPECMKRIAKYKVKKIYYQSENYASVNKKQSFEMAALFQIDLIKIN